MKFTIPRRWSFCLPPIEVDIDESLEAAPYGVKLRAAVLVARKLGADLAHAVLTNADLTGADLKRANLAYADLTGAVLTGADLTYADLRVADLEGTVLTGANLGGTNLEGTNLEGTVLAYADLTCANLAYAVLTGADLRGAVLVNANLAYAVLTNADLTGADLTDALLVDAVVAGAITDCPVKIENIHQKVWSAASEPGALDMTDWHVCETTHCRAGWVVHLAGEAGRALERELGNTATAAALIYMASDPTLEKVPDFYCDNEEALADMKRMAEAEAERVAT